MRNRPLDFSDDLRIHGGPEGFEPTLPHLEAGDTDRFVELAGATVADEVHRAANKQMIHGGRQLGFNRFARVPVSDEKTCDFCTMLASRGFAYFTEETAGMYTKFHPTCRCKVIAGGRGKNTVAGYDPEEQKRYYELNNKLEYEGYSRAQRRKALEGVPIEELGEPNSGNLGRPKKPNPVEEGKGPQPKSRYAGRSVLKDAERLEGHQAKRKQARKQKRKEALKEQGAIPYRVSKDGVVTFSKKFQDRLDAILKNDNPATALLKRYIPKMKAPRITSDEVSFYRPSEKLFYFTRGIGDKPTPVNLSTVFHEWGHAIDWILGDGKAPISTTWRDGAIAKSVRRETDAHVKRYEQKMIPRIRKILSTAEALDTYSKPPLSWITRDEAIALKSGSLSVKQVMRRIEGTDRGYAIGCKALSDDLRKIAQRDKSISSVADIISGATAGKAGWGHGEDYWEEGDEMMASESFTHLGFDFLPDARIQKHIEEYFGDSYNLVQEMLKEKAPV